MNKFFALVLFAALSGPVLVSAKKACPEAGRWPMGADNTAMSMAEIARAIAGDQASAERNIRQRLRDIRVVNNKSQAAREMIGPILASAQTIEGRIDTVKANYPNAEQRRDEMMKLSNRMDQLYLQAKDLSGPDLR